MYNKLEILLIFISLFSKINLSICVTISLRFLNQKYKKNRNFLKKKSRLFSMVISIYHGWNGILDHDVWQKSRCHREEPPVIDSSVGSERGCYRRLGTLERETAGDWLATTTPIGGAYRHMVATKIYSRFAGHNVPGQLVCTMVELLHQFTQRRRAARIGTHLFILNQTSKSINISRTPTKILIDSLLIEKVWKSQIFWETAIWIYKFSYIGRLSTR